MSDTPTCIPNHNADCETISEPGHAWRDPAATPPWFLGQKEVRW